MRKQIAAANWKMNLTLQEGEKLLDELLDQSHSLNESREVVVAVPFPYLSMALSKANGKAHVSVAAQNCYSEKSGAFTGEVSAGMLASMGVTYVIIGHSERREIFGENNELLARKVVVALENKLIPIFCCGEPLGIREEETQNKYVESQIRESLFNLDAETLRKVVIAYEPIWAIGTGKTASPEQAEEMHAHIRNVLEAAYGKAVAGDISVLYGGSVKGSNAKEIFGKPNVDGGLVGGASLKAEEFGQIIDALK